ncbi:MAG: hotdog fold domain-containing protein [Anaerolineales bacterium]
MNIWPPYLGAGIRVRKISLDYREVLVEMPLHWYNRNYVGTHFGGSLSAMTDPFYMLMLINNLGSGYMVWDKSAAIEFVRPGRGTVRAHFRLDARRVEEIRVACADGRPHFPEFEVDVLDEAGETVARVHKVLYVRLKNHAALSG